MARDMPDTVPTVLGDGLPTVRKPTIPSGLLLLGGYLLLAAAYLSLPRNGSARVILDDVLLVAGPLAAAIACVNAARTAERGSRSAWTVFAIGSFIGLAANLWTSADHTLRPGLDPFLLPSLLLIAFRIALAVGAAMALQLRERGLVAEIALDAALILVAAAVVVLRFTPAAEVASQRTVLMLVRQLGGLLTTLAGPLASLCALTFFGLLLVWRHSPMVRTTAIGLTGAAACFVALDILLAVSSDQTLSTRGSSLDVLRFAGWTFLFYAGVSGARGSEESATPLEPTQFAARLRQAVVPASVFFICIAWIDAALYPPGRIEVNLALAFMGALVAIRVTQLLHTAQQEVAQRRELAHTRALVEVSQALAGAKDLRQTLDLVAGWACRLLDARSTSIELLEADGKMLQLQAGFNMPPEAIGLRFPTDSSFSGWVVRNGKPRVTDNAALDPFFHPESLSIVGHSPMASAPLHYRDDVLGALSCISTVPLDKQQLELLGALADQAALAIENARLFEQVTALSLTDPLTGLANRRQLDKDLAREFAAARRGRRLVCVLFDLDNFKLYNDNYGHLAGDEALRLFARALTTETRAMNLAARYGGDEFLVLLTDSDLAGADTFIERVRQRFPQPSTVQPRTQLTVAAGVSEYRAEMSSPDEMVAEADLALYQNKSRRNR
jgi:diguanylate cyclase (GGDEF)-like protein